MSNIKLFESNQIRATWNESDQKWYFVIADVVQVLTDTPNPTDYIKKMRKRDTQLSEGWGQFVTPLSVDTIGGKQKLNCASAKGLLRIIQSITSPRAEPFKLWLAKVGYERLQETVDPQIAVDRARKHWQGLGRSAKWIQQRMMGIETRNKLTDYWKDAGVAAQGAWYVSAGQGMGQVLTMAGQLEGYTLTDRATYAAYRDKTGLDVLVEGDAKMFNPYGVIVVNVAKHSGLNTTGATAFADWLTSAEGQKAIADFKIGGLQMFFPSAK